MEPEHDAWQLVLPACWGRGGLGWSTVASPRGLLGLPEGVRGLRGSWKCVRPEHCRWRASPELLPPLTPGTLVTVLSL